VKTYITARNAEELHTTAKALSELGECIAIPSNLSTVEGVTAFAEAVSAQENDVHILVNNAGTSSTSRLEEMSNEIMTADIELKVYGAVYGTRHALPYLKKSDSGVIINTTTPGGKAPAAGTQPTALSRAAGISLTKTWSKEFAEFNIRVNTICIGLIKSGQHRTSWARTHEDNSDYSLDDHWQKLSQAVPLGRVGEADEAGDVICFLASPKASYVTGTSVNIDGGLSPVV